MRTQKLQTEIERLLLAAPGGLTHAELARMTNKPQPSVRAALQQLRAGRPRFKAGEGMFDIVELGKREVEWRPTQKVWGVQWRTKSYNPTEVKVFITGEDGVKREVSSIVGNVKFNTLDNEPGDFDSGTAKVA